MIKSLIITHGKLGEELLKAAEIILEENLKNLCTVINWDYQIDQAQKKIENIIKKNIKDQFIIFTDMFGGSPSNICFKYIQKNRVEIITGINLPGLLRFLTYRKQEIEFSNLVHLIKKFAIDGINVIGDYSGEKNK